MILVFCGTKRLILLYVYITPKRDTVQLHLGFYVTFCIRKNNYVCICRCVFREEINISVHFLANNKLA